MLPPTAMKLMAMGASAKRGIEGVNKQLKKISPEARAEKVRAKEKAKQDKEIAKTEKHASREFLRAHGSLLQKMADSLKTKSALQKAEEAQIERLNKAHTDKIQKQIDDEKKQKYESDWDEATKEELMGTGAENARKDQESKVKKAKKKEKKEEPKEEPEEETDVSPSLDPLPAVSAPKIPGTDSGENELAEIIKPVVVGEAMVVHNDPLEEILAIDKRRLELDERREDREIKEDRRALEDRRDRKGAKLLGKGKGSPLLNKKEGSGFFSTIGKSLLNLGTKYLLPIATSVAGLVGIKKFLQGADNADDIAKLANKVDDVAKGVGKVAPHVDDGLKGVAKTTQLASHVKNAGLADDALKGVAKTTELGKKVTLADDALKGVAKTSQLVNYSDDIIGVGTKVDDGFKGAAKSSQVVDVLKTSTTKFDDLARAGTYADDFAGITKSIGSSTSSINTTLSGVAKSNKLTTVATSLDVVAGNVDNLGSSISKIDESVKASAKGVEALKKGQDVIRLNSAGRAINSSGQFVRAADGMNSLDDAARGVANATTPPPGNAGKAIANTASSAMSSADNVAQASEDAAKLASTLNKGGQTGGKLLGRLAKILTPLDIFNKMEQGQGLGESVINMGVELSSMAVGLADFSAEMNSKGLSWLTGGFMSKDGQGLLGNANSEGFLKDDQWGSSARALETGDAFDNKDKWDTSLLEQGINKAVAGITGTEQVANKKQWTEEQEKLAEAAEDSGAVDLNYLGPSDIDDLEAVTLLDPASLQALLDFKVWDDKDMKMLEDIRDAKKEGRSVTYNDNGWFGKEGVDFGEKGSPVANKISQLNKTGQSLDESGNLKYTDDGGEYGMPRGAGNTSDAGRQEAMERILTERAYTEMGSNREKVLDARLMKLKGMTAEEFNALTPNVKTQDKFFSDATNPGSIYTHDTHVEALLQKLVPTDSNPSVNSEMLESNLVTAQMSQAKQNKGTGGNSQVNTNVDNSATHNNITNVPSTAHAPFSPSGAGVMGVNTPRG